MEIIQKIAQGQERSVIIGREVRKGLFPELGGDAGPGGGAIGLANLPVAGELILREHLQGGIPGSGIIEDDLRRGEPGHLIEQVDTGVGAGKGRGMGLAGGDITGGKAGLILPQPGGGAEVAAAGLQGGVVQDGAGGDHPDNVPLYKALGRGRVLGLLADGHLIALGNEPGNVPVRGVVGDAAHRHLLVKGLILILVSGCEGQVQLPGSRPGVGAEHLVKIAQAEEQDGVLVLLLDFQVLLHHGGQFSHNRSHLSAAGAAGLAGKRWKTLWKSAKSSYLGTKKPF